MQRLAALVSDATALPFSHSAALVFGLSCTAQEDGHFYSRAALITAPWHGVRGHTSPLAIPPWGASRTPLCPASLAGCTRATQKLQNIEDV